MSTYSFIYLANNCWRPSMFSDICLYFLKAKKSKHNCIFLHIKRCRLLAKLISEAKAKANSPKKPNLQGKKSSSPWPLAFWPVSPIQNIFCDYYITQTICHNTFFHPPMKSFYRDRAKVFTEGLLHSLKKSFFRRWQCFYDLILQFFQGSPQILNHFITKNFKHMQR